MTNHLSPTIKLPTVRFKGFWRLQARRDGKLRADTGWIEDRADTGWIPNLITNIGLEAIGEALAIGRYCVVGTGNTAPTTANTALQSPVAVRDFNGATSTGIVTTGDRYGWQRRTYVFAEGAVTGTIAEVGVGWSYSVSTPLLSRSLVSPAVTIVALDQLTCVYELRMYLPTADSTGSVTINGTPYNFTVRPIQASNSLNAGFQNYGWSPGLLALSNTTRQWVSTNPGASFYGARAYRAPCILTPIDNTGLLESTGPDVNATSDYADGYTNHTYVPASLEATYDTEWSIARANWPGVGIQGFVFTGLFGTYQCILNTPIMDKNSTTRLQMNWKQSWARR